MEEVRLIDANALHKRIEMNLRASNPFTIEECCYKDALNSVDEAPTIDPKWHTGRKFPAPMRSVPGKTAHGVYQQLVARTRNVERRTRVASKRHFARCVDSEWRMCRMTMIDRDELLKKIDPMSLSNGSVLGRHSGTADVIAEMIQNAPAIDPESLRGHAKWVKDKELKFIIVDDENKSHEEPAICCTHCKAKISQSDFDSWVWNFCPVCGFKMEDETEEQHETD